MEKARDLKQKHYERLYTKADQALRDMGHIAPEDIGMRRTKILDRMLEACEPLDIIHTLLDQQEWSSDTLEAIAGVLRQTGFVIREPEGED